MLEKVFQGSRESRRAMEGFFGDHRPVMVSRGPCYHPVIPCKHGALTTGGICPGYEKKGALVHERGFMNQSEKIPQGSEEFIAEQKKILKENPECATTSYNLGVGFLKQGKLDEAIDAFYDAIDTSGRMFEAYVNLGYIFFKKGDLERVAECNKRAVEIEPRYARGYANLGFAYLQMSRTREAIEALKKAIELNPDIAQAWCNLANAYLQEGALENAVETGEKLVEMAPDFALGHNNLAFAYYSRGDHQSALEHLDKAISLGFEAHPEFVEKLAPYRQK